MIGGLRQNLNLTGNSHVHRELSRKVESTNLSKDDLKELKMEWIDVVHFVFNAGLAIGITPKEFYNYYLSKNDENWARAKSGRY